MTSKNTKKNLKQNKRIPRISTRGFYDLSSGKTLKKKPYDLYPKKFFEELGNYPEFTIMVHGMRNNKSSAITKFRIAKKRLRQLGYGYPVVGFSYDSNVKGAQYRSTEVKATNVGRIIARKNGYNLAKFITLLKEKNSDIRIKLIGHSLGTEVIASALKTLEKRKMTVYKVYFFGSSLSSEFIKSSTWGGHVQKTVLKKIMNYYNPGDEVLKSAHDLGIVNRPIGCFGIKGKTIPKYVQKRVRSPNHRFASYAKVLRSY